MKVLSQFKIALACVAVTLLLGSCEQVGEDSVTELDLTSFQIGSTTDKASVTTLTSPTAAGAAEQPEQVVTLIAGFVPVSAFASSDAQAIAQAVQQPTDPDAIVDILKGNPDNLQVVSLPATSIIRVANPTEDTGPWVLVAFGTRRAVNDITELTTMPNSPIIWGGIALDPSEPNRAAIANKGLVLGGQAKINLQQLFCGDATHEPENSCPKERTVKVQLEWLSGEDDDGDVRQLEILRNSFNFETRSADTDALVYSLVTTVTTMGNKDIPYLTIGELTSNTLKFSRFRETEINLTGTLVDEDASGDGDEMVPLDETFSWSAEVLNGDGCAAYAHQTQDITLASVVVRLHVMLEGSNCAAPSEPPRPVEELAVSKSHVCVRTESNSIYCWGNNADGQLGQGHNDGPVGDAPQEMGNNLPAVLLQNGGVAQQLSSGPGDHQCVATEAFPYCWGDAEEGQLASGNTDSYIPLRPWIVGPSLTGSTGNNAEYRPTKMYIGETSTYGIDGDTQLAKSWGSLGESGGWLGLGLNPGPPKTGQDGPPMGQMIDNNDLDVSIKFMAAATRSVCVVNTADQLLCAGTRSKGQTLSGEDSNNQDNKLMMRDVGGETITQLSAGEEHHCALLESNQVKCWGHGNKGQLGQGNGNNWGDAPEEINLPPAVDLGTGWTPVQVAAGLTHSCALNDVGRVKCWGSNNSGQLGLGVANSRGNAADQMGDNLAEVPISNVTNIAAGEDFTCALTQPGYVRCWGKNEEGQLGLGITNANLGRTLAELEGMEEDNVYVNIGGINSERMPAYTLP